MTENRNYIRDQLEAAWLARQHGHREQAIKTLIHALAEGDGSPEENLRVLVEEAQRHADRRRPRPATTPGKPPK